MVTGSTLEARQQARAERATRRRIKFFADRIRDARNGREQVAHATDYAKAVADDMDDARRHLFAQALVAVIEEWRSQ